MDYVREPFSGVIPLNQVQGLGRSPENKDTAPAAAKPTATTTPAAQQKNGVTMTGIPADKVVINPEYVPVREAAEKEVHAAMTFGRMNPPTIGHEKLIHKVESVAKENNGSAHIIASHTEGNAKNPVPQKAKLGYLKKVAKKTTTVTGSSKEHPTFLQHAAELHKQGVTHLHMVAGSDRVGEYKEKLNKYNGTHEGALYNFKHITVHDAGHRDPDAEGSEGMSGSKMRALAHAGKKKEFKAGLPKALHPHAEEIAGHIRAIKEETIVEARKVSSLEKWRAAATEREKQHAAGEAERAKLPTDQRMTDAINKLASRFQKEEKIDEVSSELLDRYKAKAKISADKLSDQGKYKKSTDRWSNIMKATGKQIDKTTANISKSLRNEDAAVEFRLDHRDKPMSDIKATMADHDAKVSDTTDKAMYIKVPAHKADSFKSAMKAKHSAKVELEEETSMQTRLHRAQVMRRNAKKLANARKLTRGRLAKGPQLRRRALKKARSLIRSRVVGKKGGAYNKLSMSDKVAFDRIANSHEKQVIAIANKIGNRVKRNDISRVTHGKRSSIPIVASYEQEMKNTITEKAAIALKQKAAKSGFDFNTIVEVFARGIESYPQDSKLTVQQYAFGRVNSFLAQGKAFNEDADLTSRRQVKYTARQMGDTSTGQLPSVLSFGEFKKDKKKIDSDPNNASRRKADLVRRAATEMKKKIIESKGTVFTRVANKIVRSKSPQINVLKKNIVDTLKKKDYDGLANIIIYLMRDKLSNGARIRQEDVCVPEEDYIYETYTEEQWNQLVEENNEGRALNKPFRTPSGPKKFAVYVKNDKGNVIKLGFGDPNLEIKRDDPDRRKAYRARHGCDNPGPRWKANWWSCNWSWSADKKVGA